MGTTLDSMLSHFYLEILIYKWLPLALGTFIY